MSDKQIETGSKIIDLMDALKASLAKAPPQADSTERAPTEQHDTATVEGEHAIQEAGDA